MAEFTFTSSLWSPGGGAFGADGHQSGGGARRGESEKKGFTYRTLMVAGMHFMDSYNYDVERVKRCVIHYAAPNGKVYPFCAYNSGPVFRERIEKEFSVPFEEQEEMQRLTLKGKKGCGTCVNEPELVG
jgi:hypothetical protein